MKKITQTSKGNKTINAGGDVIVTKTTNNYIMGNFSKIESLLPKITSVLIDAIDSYDLDPQINLNFTPTLEKLTYNNVINYKPLIESYGRYSLAIDNVFTEFEQYRIGTKNRFLRWINSKYLIEKGKYENVCLFGDQVIKSLVDELTVYYKQKDDYNGKDILSEDLDLAILYVICRAFVECKILETIKQ